MKFIPSLLEYSAEHLEQKLNLVTNNLDTFRQVQKGNDLLAFHLDFVLPQFAKDRKVMSSLSFQTIAAKLSKFFENTNLDLSVHFMGTTEDLYMVNDFLKDYAFNPKWQYTIYVPANFTTTFEYHTRIYDNLKLGIWLDKELWNDNIIKEKSELVSKFLLMTVFAGKSGQHLTQEEIDKVNRICKLYPELHFLADGGWSVDSLMEHPNLEIISYTSFWKTFEQNLKLA